MRKRYRVSLIEALNSGGLKELAYIPFSATIFNSVYAIRGMFCSTARSDDDCGQAVFFFSSEDVFLEKNSIFLHGSQVSAQKQTV